MDIQDHQSRKILVGAARFELTTPCSQSKCASQTALRPDWEQHKQILSWSQILIFDKCILCQRLSSIGKNTFES